MAAAIEAAHAGTPPLDLSPGPRMTPELRAELDRRIKEARPDGDKMPMDEGIKGELPDESIR